MTGAALMIFALMLLAAAASPGPNIAALVARVLTNGLREVLPFLAGMWIGEAIWLSFAVGADNVEEHARSDHRQIEALQH